MVSKHPGSGGLVSVHTITEQLLYEMGAPSYLSPDCTARFDSISLRQMDRTGSPYRAFVVSRHRTSSRFRINTADGYRSFGRTGDIGSEGKRKAELVAATLWEEAGGEDNFEATSTQLLGIDACHPTHPREEPAELLLQLAARDADKGKIDAGLNRRIVSKVLGSVPGIT